MIDRRSARRSVLEGAIKALRPSAKMLDVDDGGPYLAVVVVVGIKDIERAMTMLRALRGRALSRYVLVCGRATYPTFAVVQDEGAVCLPTQDLNARAFAERLLREQTPALRIVSWRSRRSEERAREVLSTLAKCEGNKSEAARQLGISRQHVGRIVTASRADGKVSVLRSYDRFSEVS